METELVRITSLIDDHKLAQVKKILHTRELAKVFPQGIRDIAYLQSSALRNYLCLDKEN